MILFFTLFTSTPTLAQTVSVIHKVDSDTIIASNEDDVSIKVHRLPSSENQTQNDSLKVQELSKYEELQNSKVAIFIHKISEE